MNTGQSSKKSLYRSGVHYLDTVFCRKYKAEQPTEFHYCTECGTELPKPIKEE